MDFHKLKAVVSGVWTSYLRRGKGPALIALQGFLGRDAAVVVDQVQESHEGFAPDLPGFWDSEESPEPVTVPFLGGWLDDFHSLVVGHRRVVLFGFSAGATAAIHYAATHRDAVERMVLYEPIIRGQELPAWLRALIRLTAIPGATSFILKAAPNAVPMLPGVRKVGWERRLRLIEGVSSTKNLGEVARSLLKWDATEELWNIGEVPVLIVRGSKPSFVPHDTLTDITPRHVSHLQLPGLDHLLSKRGQEEVVRASADFIKARR
jgi:pimeloyl-ACP methyl ester carboxylesterase